VNLEDLDRQLLQVINHPSSLNVDIYIVTAIFAVYGFLIFLLYFYFRKNYTEKFAHLMLTALVGYLIVTVVKYLVQKPRPYTEGDANAVITKPYDPYSFPSGHSFVAFLLVNFLPETWPRWAKIASLVYITFVPIASVYIGVHYPSDVLVGSLFGLLFPKIFSAKISKNIFSLFSRF